MPIIEFHVLRLMPPGNYNRGEDGHPKTTEFGGCVRGMVSSQCLNRNQRERLMADEILSRLCGIRTRKIGLAVFEQLPDYFTEESKVPVSKFVSNVFAKKDKDGENSKQAVFYNKAEITHMSKIIVEVCDGPERFSQWFAELTSKPDSDKEDQSSEKPEKKVKAKSKKAKSGDSESISEILRERLQNLSQPCDLDVALYGRMAQGYGKVNLIDDVRGCWTTSIQLGVNAYNPFDNFTSSVDDLGMTGEGAAFCNTRVMHSPLLYTYHKLDLAQLFVNMSHLESDTELLDDILRAIVWMVYEVVPQTMITKTGHQVPPVCLFSLCSKAGMGYSFANAFETPVSVRRENSSLCKKAVAKLLRYYLADKPNRTPHTALWLSSHYLPRCKTKGSWATIPNEDIHQHRVVDEFANEIIALCHEIVAK